MCILNNIFVRDQRKFDIQQGNLTARKAPYATTLPM